MPDLRRAFESAGFADVRTMLSSGNVVFSAGAAAEAVLQRKAEAAMLQQLGHAFLTIVRPSDALAEILASDPYRAFRLDPGAKRVVTFLREALNKAAHGEQFRAALANLGQELAYMDQPEFAQFWDTDTKRIEAAIRSIGKVEG